MNTETSIQDRIASMRSHAPTITHEKTQTRFTPPQTLSEARMVNVEKKWAMKQVALQLNIGFKELFGLLREQKLFTKVGKNNLPISSLITKGYFINELKKFSRGTIENSYTKTYVTATGISFLSELIAEHKRKSA